MSRTRLFVAFLVPAIILAGFSPVSLSLNQAPHLLNTITHQVQTVLPVCVTLANLTGPLFGDVLLYLLNNIQVGRK